MTSLVIAGYIASKLTLFAMTDANKISINHNEDY